MLNANEFLSELYSRLDAENPLYNKGQIHIENFIENEIANYYIDQYLSILPANKNVKILDIGVGEGWFASICYKLGYQHVELADFGCKLKFSEIKKSLNEVKKHCMMLKHQSKICFSKINSMISMTLSICHM